MTTTAKALRTWRDHPVQLVKDLFNAQPDPWQAELLHALPQHQRLCMSACKGPGKSCVLAWAIWWFLLTRPHPKVACTSITGDNLADGLWTELAKWRGRSELLTQEFEWTKTRIMHRTHYQTWWASARTWSRGADAQQQADTLSGLHADYILFVLDEAGGIPDAVMAAAEAALASPREGRILIGGNPTHTEGPLWRAVTTENHLWYVTHITGDPDDPKRSPRIATQWANEQIQKYGRDNPWVLVNVFGKFPPASLNALLSIDDVQAAQQRAANTDDYAFAQRRLGIDVARFGDDRTVLFPRQGLMAFRPVEMRNARTDEIAARAMLAKQRWNTDLECVDDTGGYGAGVIDAMRQAGAAPLAVHFSGKPMDNRYLNKRAEMWFDLAEWVKRGGCLPNIPELTRELTTPQYTFKQGRFRIEDKSQIKDRLGFSPDYADALALTFALPDQPTDRDPLQTLVQRHRQTAQCEYDPYAHVP